MKKKYIQYFKYCYNCGSKTKCYGKYLKKYSCRNLCIKGYLYYKTIKGEFQVIVKIKNTKFYIHFYNDRGYFMYTLFDNTRRDFNSFEDCLEFANRCEDNLCFM